MSELSKLADTLSIEIEERLKEAIVEAREAREACPTGTIEDDPQTLHEHLLMTRAQIERLEHLAAELGRIRSVTYSAMTDAKDEYDDAYMNAATAKSVGFPEYATGKEKDAHFDLAAISEKVRWRRAKRLHDQIDGVWSFARTLLRGAEGVHRDLEVRIRLITLAGQLDR